MYRGSSVYINVHKGSGAEKYTAKPPSGEMRKEREHKACTISGKKSEEGYTNEKTEKNQTQ